MNDSISYRPLPPPFWARIKLEIDGPTAPPPILTVPPALIKLEAFSRCSCRNERGTFNPERPIELRRCFIYGLLNACSASIEVQKCLSCRHGYIGPDCTEIGIFNLNNRSLFTLMLLDDYTCNFTRSETPFVSWVSSTACRYQNHRSPINFIKEKAFRTAWFSYSRLIRLERDMECLRCGPFPKVTIWDGVTLAFNRKNLLPTLRPPTFTSAYSKVKPHVRPEHGLQVFKEKGLRRVIQSILTGLPLCLPELPADHHDSATQSPDPTAAMKEMMDRIGMVPNTVERLSALSPCLGVLFQQWFGLGYLLSKQKPPAEYKELFLQVHQLVLAIYCLSSLFQMAAEENAVQLINERALENLQSFMSSQRLELLTRIPVLYRVAEREFQMNSALDSMTLAVFRWIYIRVYVVLNQLKKMEVPLEKLRVPFMEFVLITHENAGSCNRQRPNGVSGVHLPVGFT